MHLKVLGSVDLSCFFFSFKVMYDHIRDRFVVIFNNSVLGIISRPCTSLTTDLYSKPPSKGGEECSAGVG